ncbi:hypothetical protein FQR65_LT13468 [Abscondita terminalis]|nr:hypothetical protein FQR65_LT13468 [Abscondita terminalis]
MGKINKNIENDEKKKLLLSQETKLIRALSGNQKKIREQALRNLKDWMQLRNSKIPFSLDDFTRIWKGLFCSMWMSDKPLVQERCAEDIAHLIHQLPEASALLFFRAGLELMSIEWVGIDQWRLDKFLMFVRRLLRQVFVFLRKYNWKVKLVHTFSWTLSETLLSKKSKCLGLTMHLSEIFLEELAKVSKGKISPYLVTQMLKPFIHYMSEIDDDRQIKHALKCMFYHLMQQSDVGLEHDARFNAWKKEGFPGGNINLMEKMDNHDDNNDSDESDDDERALDPRAGSVHVDLPQLKVDTDSLLELINNYKFKKTSTTKGKKALTQLQRKFEKLAEGSFPLGITKVPQFKKQKNSTLIEKSVTELDTFNKQLRREKKEFQENFKTSTKKAKDVSKQNGVRRDKKEFQDDFKTPTKKTKDVSKQNGFDTTVLKEKLDDLFSKDEELVKNWSATKRKLSSPDPNWSFENSFKRNSGVWTVHRLATDSPYMNGSPTPVSPATEWKQKLQEGETEIFVPSNKFKAKMKAQGKNIDDIIDKIIQKPKLVKNPFSIPKSGEKKVRIALKLNQSQEIHEHVAQLKSSPGIPYDANKMPEKPLLKPNSIKSPINPFYKRKLKL